MLLILQWINLIGIYDKESYQASMNYKTQLYSDPVAKILLIIYMLYIQYIHMLSIQYIKRKKYKNKGN